MSRFWALYKKAVLVPVLPIIWFATSVFGIVAGPFGTFEALDFWGRVIFWPLILGCAILIGAASRVVVQDYMGIRRPLPESLLISGFSIVGLTPPSYGIMYWLTDGRITVLVSFLKLAGYIFVVSLVTSMLRHALGGTTVAPAAKEADPAPEEGPRLMQRLDPDMRRPILRMQVRDHYVDVVTDAGQASLLIRFGDAIAETEGVAGIQVHRSHWVARDAVTGVRREKGKVVLLTRDGAEVPVSKTYQPAVEAEGLVSAAE